MLLVFLALFFSAQVQAQTDYDTATVAIDTTTTVEDSPYKDEETDVDQYDKKENFLKYWKNNYDTTSLEQRKLSDSLVKKMQADKDFWYANKEFEKEKKEKQKQKDDNYDINYIPLGQRTWFQTLIWIIIIGGFAAFLMIYLSGSNVSLFRKSSKTIRSDEEAEIVTEDIFAINYQKEIDKAVAQQNYRLAVRLMYLRLLKNMSEKNIIQYKQDKTNFDYLMQLHGTRYYTNFFRITHNYEYSWYGKFDVSEEAYKVISRDFEQFDNELKY